MGDKKRKGSQGEAVAKAYLLRKGYIILAANYRCAQGEADLVVRDGETVVFVEVKYRAGLGSGAPREAVDARKQARIRRIALHYSAAHGLFDSAIRFDVIEVTGRIEFLVTHIENAF